MGTVADGTATGSGGVPESSGDPSDGAGAEGETESGDGSETSSGGEPACQQSRVVFEAALGGEPFAFAHDPTGALVAALVTDAKGSDAVVAIDVADPDAPQVLPPIEAIYDGGPATLRYGLLGLADGEAVMQSAEQLMSWYTLDLGDPDAELSWLGVDGPWHHDPFVVAYDGGRAAAMAFETGGYCPEVGAVTGHCISVFAARLGHGTQLYAELDSFARPSLAHREGRLAAWTYADPLVALMNTEDVDAATMIGMLDASALGASTLHDVAVSSRWLALATDAGVFALPVDAADPAAAVTLSETIDAEARLTLTGDLLDAVTDVDGVQHWLTIDLAGTDAPVEHPADLLLAPHLTALQPDHVYTLSAEGAFRVIARCG